MSPLFSKKVNEKIETIREKLKDHSDIFKESVKEEIKELEILFGKEGLHYNIDRLDKLLYGNVQKHWFTELRMGKHFSSNTKIILRGSYNKFVVKNLLKSISQIGFINLIKLAFQQMKLTHTIKIMNHVKGFDEEIILDMRKYENKRISVLDFPEKSETMTSYERFNKALELKEPDRVPITPLMDYFYAADNKMSSKEFVLGPIENVISAVKNTYARYNGILDMVHFPMGRLYGFYNMLPLGPSGFYNELNISEEIPSSLQFIEKGYIDVNDFPRIYKHGLRTVWKSLPHQKVLETQMDILKIGKFIEFWEKKQEVPIYATSGIVTPLEGLCYLMGIKNWSKALKKSREEVKNFCEFLLDGTLANDYVMYCLTQVKRSYICLERVSPIFISSKNFEYFVLENLKRIVRENVRNDLTTIFHMDTDWTPFFHYFLEFPKNGKYILHLEDSDIKKAKEMLGHQFCIMGNIQTKLLRFGTKEQIVNKTKELMDICKDGGGYMMAEGCEVAPDTPPENLKAWIDTSLKYGQY